MTTTAAHWRAFRVRAFLSYVVASWTGLGTTLVAAILVCRFSEFELRLSVRLIIALIIAAGLIQITLDRRNLRPVRRWLSGGATSTDRDVLVRVYKELLRYPWSSSWLGFWIWQFAVAAYFAGRMYWLRDAPVYRHLMLAELSIGASFLNWTIQYFLLRRSTTSLIESLPLTVADVADVPRRSLLSKYMWGYGSTLIGVVVLASCLSYGLNRDLALNEFFRQVHRITFQAEELLYRFGSSSFDFQQRLAALNARLPGELSITTVPPREAIDLTRLRQKSAGILGLDVDLQETQRIAPRMTFVRPLAIAENRGTAAMLQYDVPTTSLTDSLRETLIRLSALAFVLFALVTIGIVVSIRQITRPIQMIRSALHPSGDAFRTPPMPVSDDELLGFSAGIRSMFNRLQLLFQELLGAYWQVKDERARLHGVAERFQQRVQRDEQQVELLTGRLRQIAEQIRTFSSQLEAMDATAQGAQQAISTMSETLVSMSRDVIVMRGRVLEGRDWIRSGGDEMSTVGQTLQSLNRWISGAQQEFDGILRRFRDLVVMMDPVDDQIGRFSDAVRFGADRVRTVYQLLASESDRYNEGAILLEKTQDNLEDVMEEFREVESIREQIEMLSFQAAVVASQSIEFERDFRVVADEIRDLSERASVGIQRIFAAIWALDQQGKQTISRIVGSRRALTDARATSERAWMDAEQGMQYASDFAEDMLNAISVVRDEADRTEALVLALREPFQRGSALSHGVSQVLELYEGVRNQVRRLDDLSRRIELRLREQEDALRVSERSVGRVTMQIRELIGGGESVVEQARSMRLLLQKLSDEAAQTGSRIAATLRDLDRIEADIFRNEAEVKRISAELQARDHAGD
ncbi:MAG: hypothetical protein D6761_12845 [Candidatus Dadabacteria bacterium]|nr:MAG: hypothetical protein D6761_12845 [Candidatus Dadabacteria bacterium]